MENISIYDNGGKTIDRITVIFDKEKRQTKDGILYNCVGSSETGSGFYQHSEAMKGKHLGKKITFYQLTPELQKLIKKELEQ